MNTLLLVAVVGALAGLHAATWGAYKDSPFEGFRPTSFVRSIVVGAGCAVALSQAGVLATSDGPLVVVGICYAGERLVTEWWKAILREDPQAAYSIPMRLAVHGRPVDRRLPRYALGVAVALGIVVAFLVASRSGLSGAPAWAVPFIVGLGGWLTAVGGAWKDAPIEGFQLAKFFRSPVVATAWGMLLLQSSDNLPVVVVAAGGLSVASIETYKTFLSGGPPGKFAGKPVRFRVARYRRSCRLGHAATYAALAGALAALVLLEGGGHSAGLGREGALLAAFSWALGCLTLVLEPLRSATVESSQGSEITPEPTGRPRDADTRRASI